MTILKEYKGDCTQTWIGPFGGFQSFSLDHSDLLYFTCCFKSLYQTLFHMTDTIPQHTCTLIRFPTSHRLPLIRSSSESFSYIYRTLACMFPSSIIACLLVSSLQSYTLTFDNHQTSLPKRSKLLNSLYISKFFIGQTTNHWLQLYNILKG